MSALNRLLALPRRGGGLLLVAAALQLGARLILQTHGLPLAARLAERIGGRSTRTRDLQTLAWALAASASRVGGTCLTQALAARALGASPSRPARLVIGVRPGDGPPEFHAWTEIAGTEIPSTPARASFSHMIVWS